MIDKTEHLEPRNFTQPVSVVARHVQRYLDAIKLHDESGNGQVWLDFGCGSGYGASLLFEFASKVVGYDPNAQPVQGVARTNVLLLSQLPISLQVDVVFCIEVIEHTEDPVKLLEQMKGTRAKAFLISTPIVSKTNHRPVNPHHCIEYDLNEFTTLLNAQGLHVVASEIKATTFTDGETKQQGLFKVIQNGNIL